MRRSRLRPPIVLRTRPMRTRTRYFPLSNPVVEHAGNVEVPVVLLARCDHWMVASPLVPQRRQHLAVERHLEDATGVDVGEHPVRLRDAACHAAPEAWM